MYEWVALTLTRIQTTTDEFVIMISFSSWSAKLMKLVIFSKTISINLHFALNCISSSSLSKYGAELFSEFHFFCLNSSSVSCSPYCFTSGRITGKMMLIQTIKLHLKKLFTDICGFASDFLHLHESKFFQYDIFAFWITVFSSSLKYRWYFSEILQTIFKYLWNESLRTDFSNQVLSIIW